ncbi:MAG: ATP-binding cassette domain-containing protein, partial [Flavobacteriaceae bacterium]|nr:ATP-binding cassette domain-containing protein [Flavobacteriaceae bacterium]
QDPYASLNPRMTVSQIVEEPLKIHTELKGPQRREKVITLLEKVGLREDQAGRFPHEFSGGQRQRVGIARALAPNPDLIICDEPVSALDVSIQAQVINLMVDLQKEFDVSFLFIAHDLSVVEHISDKIAVMYLGNLVEFGESKQVYHHPRHPYSKALLSAVPVPDPKKKNRQRIILKGDVLYKNRLLMLDIIANNDWKRPIYFSGGAFGDDDYIWMKEYLQLEGVVYKLVPIRTPLDRGNPFDMGRIDTDKMYDIVMNWKWGNSGNTEIYHDVETRRNGITYRSNMSRLASALIEEGKFDKAEKVYDLAMEKMPVDYFEFYSLLEPFILGYYQIGKDDKAREVYQSVVKHYQEHLLFYSKLSYSRQEAIGDEIFSDLGRYRGLIDVLASFDTEEYTVVEAEKFNTYLQLFNFSQDQNDMLDVKEELLHDKNNETLLDTIPQAIEDSMQ